MPRQAPPVRDYGQPVSAPARGHPGQPPRPAQPTFDPASSYSQPRSRVAPPARGYGQQYAPARGYDVAARGYGQQQYAPAQGYVQELEDDYTEGEFTYPEDDYDQVYEPVEYDQVYEPVEYDQAEVDPEETGLEDAIVYYQNDLNRARAAEAEVAEQLAEESRRVRERTVEAAKQLQHLRLREAEPRRSALGAPVLPRPSAQSLPPDEPEDSLPEPEAPRRNEGQPSGPALTTRMPVPAASTTGEKKLPAASTTGAKNVPAASTTGEKNTSAASTTGAKNMSAASTTGEKKLPAASTTGAKNVPAASTTGEKNTSAASTTGAKNVSAASTTGEKNTSAAQASAAPGGTSESAWTTVQRRHKERLMNQADDDPKLPAITPPAGYDGKAPVPLKLPKGPPGKSIHAGGSGARDVIVNELALHQGEPTSSDMMAFWEDGLVPTSLCVLEELPEEFGRRLNLTMGHANNWGAVFKSAYFPNLPGGVQLFLCDLPYRRGVLCKKAAQCLLRHRLHPWEVRAINMELSGTGHKFLTMAVKSLQGLMLTDSALDRAILEEYTKKPLEGKVFLLGKNKKQTSLRQYVRPGPRNPTFENYEQDIRQNDAESARLANERYEQTKHLQPAIKVTYRQNHASDDDDD
jgi:hypothetical protein